MTVDVDTPSVTDLAQRDDRRGPDESLTQEQRERRPAGEHRRLVATLREQRERRRPITGLVIVVSQARAAFLIARTMP